MTEEVKITDEEIISAFFKMALRYWKLIAVTMVSLGALFFGGGYYVYKDAKATTADVMIGLYNDVNKARDRAEDILEDAEVAVEEARRRLELAEKNLTKAQDTLRQNVDIMNEITRKLYQEYEHQRQQNQLPPDMQKDLQPPTKLEIPELKGIKK